MGNESNESSVLAADATATPTKKRRFPLPFRKKSKSSASDDDTNKTISREVPLNGSGALFSATTGTATTYNNKDNNSKSASKVTIVESSKKTGASVLPRPPSGRLPQQQQQQQQQDRSSAKAVKPNWLCRTKFFRNMCDWAFTVVDQDGSGSVDEKELYSGLLLIHLKLGSYAGPAACKVSHPLPYLSSSCSEHAFLRMRTNKFCTVYIGCAFNSPCYYRSYHLAIGIGKG